MLWVSGCKGSLELNGLKRLLVSAVGWSLELVSACGVALCSLCVFFGVPLGIGGYGIVVIRGQCPKGEWGLSIEGPEPDSETRPPMPAPRQELLITDPPNPFPSFVPTSPSYPFVFLG